MVTRDVIEHRVVRNGEDIILQFLQVPHPHDLVMCLGIAEDEITEAHVHGQEVPQIDVHLL